MNKVWMGILWCFLTTFAWAQSTAEVPSIGSGARWQYSNSSGRVQWEVIIEGISPDGQYIGSMHWNGEKFPTRLDRQLSRVVHVPVNKQSIEKFGGWISPVDKVYRTLDFPLSVGKKWSGEFIRASQKQDLIGNPIREVRGTYEAEVIGQKSFKIGETETVAFEIRVKMDGTHRGDWSGKEEVNETYLYSPTVKAIVYKKTEGFIIGRAERRPLNDEWRVTGFSLNEAK